MKVSSTGPASRAPSVTDLPSGPPSPGAATDAARATVARASATPTGASATKRSQGS
jgi:hypothetical protein